jgi:hypothetical protein
MTLARVADAGTLARPRGLARPTLACMREKVGRSGNDKKQGKSLKEKRAAKNAKRAERARER